MVSSDIKVWYVLPLKCGHTVFTPIRLRKQYPEDSHRIFCPFCREDKKNDMYARKIPTAWVELKPPIKVVTDDELRTMYDVSSGTPFILSRDILRLQPTVPRNRCRPFPYVRGG